MHNCTKPIKTTMYLNHNPIHPIMAKQQPRPQKYHNHPKQTETKTKPKLDHKKKQIILKKSSTSIDNKNIKYNLSIMHKLN